MKKYLILLAFCTIGAFLQGFTKGFFQDYQNIIDIFNLIIPFVLGYIYRDITKEDK